MLFLSDYADEKYYLDSCLLNKCLGSVLMIYDKMSYVQNRCTRFAEPLFFTFIQVDLIYRTSRLVSNHSQLVFLSLMPRGYQRFDKDVCQDARAKVSHQSQIAEFLSRCQPHVRLWDSGFEFVANLCPGS